MSELFFWCSIAILYIMALLFAAEVVEYAEGLRRDGETG